jgi:hypothetical protein
MCYSSAPSPPFGAEADFAGEEGLAGGVEGGVPGGIVGGIVGSLALISTVSACDLKEGAAYRRSAGR